MLVGTANGVVALARGSGAASWFFESRALEGKHVSAIVSTHEGVVFAGLYRGGVMRRLAGDAKWEPVNTGLTSHTVYSLAIAHEPGGPVLYAGTEPVSLWRSEDLGESWTELRGISTVAGAEKWRFPSPPHVPHTKALTIDRLQPSVLYAAVEQGALLKSEDAGVTWTEFTGYSHADDAVYRDVHRVVQVPGAPGTLFMTTGVGVYRSRDAGTTWESASTLRGQIGYPDALVVSPDEEGTVLVAGAKRNPLGWIRAGGAEGAVFRSLDRGETWAPANSGLPESRRANLEAMSLVTYPGGMEVFAGSTDGEIFVSEDRGAHWRRIATNVGAVSKSGHYVLLRVAAKVPRVLRPAVAAALRSTLSITGHAALALRWAAFRVARRS